MVLPPRFSPHRELAGGELAAILETYYSRTWAHYDVIKTGLISVETLPMIMRFLASDQLLNL
jgi:hypothetical protein